MRKSILFILTAITALNLYSQQTSLLKTFKYRINNYRAIGININGGASTSNNKLGTGTSKSNSSSGTLGMSYYMTKSTDKQLLSASASATGSFSFSHANTPTSNDKSRNHYGLANVYIDNKWYQPKNVFLELGANMLGIFSGNKLSRTGLPGSSKDIQNDYSVAVTAGVGKGRLENITDMQNALWLYKALQDEKRLSRELSPAELNELGRTITHSNNTRVLDFRKRAQFILETTDKFFQEKNVLASNDIRYFSTLNDILFYAFNNPRLSGTELYARITPSVNAGKDDYTNDPSRNTDKITGKSALLAVGISSYKPLNLTHQNNYGVAMKLNYATFNEINKNYLSGTVINQFELNTNFKQAFLSAFFEHAIYPNTRTVFNFRIQSDEGVQNLAQESTFFIRGTATASLNYFISYHTRLIVNAGAGGGKDAYDYSDFHYLALTGDNIYLFANMGLQVDL